MSEIMISVIIPTYNRRKLIERCLDSVASNTLSQDLYEVICVDDLSTDGTREFLQQYSKIKNFRPILREVNSGGASAPRNDGIRVARGEYIYFIDSDDYITEKTLEDGLNFAIENNSDMVCLSYHSNGRNVATSAYKTTIKKIDIENSTLINNLGCHNKLIRRDIIIRNNITFPLGIKVGEDTLFMIKCYTMANTISILTGKYYFLNPVCGDNLVLQAYPQEDVIFQFMNGSEFILQSNIDLDRKKNIFTLFFNRMMDTNYKKFNNRGLLELYKLEEKFSIFSQVLNNPRLKKKHLVQGILINSINFIKTIEEYIKNNTFDNIYIENQKAYIDFIENNTKHKIDISHINPNNIFISKFSHEDSLIRFEFYVSNSFFVNDDYKVTLLCKNRSNNSTIIFDANQIENHKNKYIAYIDLPYICINTSGKFDLYINTCIKGYSKESRIKINTINSAFKNITHSLTINNKKYNIEVYSTLYEYLALNIAVE